MKKILNLYAGIGGNRKLWDGDIQVTAVEIDPDIAKVYADFYPDDILIVGDAHEYLLNHYSEFDFIWASPPCPTHSRLCSSMKGHGIVRYPDMKLYQEIILLRHFYSGKFCIENVISYYDPLILPVVMLRHYFWTNFNITHKEIKDEMIGLRGGAANEVKEYQRILGFDLSGYKSRKPNEKRTVLRNCVLPELGKHIFDCAMGSIIDEKQLELF